MASPMVTGYLSTKELIQLWGGLQSGSSRRYEGYWKDGKMHGEGTFTYPDGHTKRGIWVNGVFTKN